MLLQAELSHFSLPRHPMSSHWPCCPAHSQGTEQKGSKKGGWHEHGFSIASWRGSARCTRKSTSTGCWAGSSWAESCIASRALVGFSTPSVLECLLGSTPSFFDDWGLNLGGEGLNLENNKTMTTDLLWERDACKSSSSLGCGPWLGAGVVSSGRATPKPGWSRSMLRAAQG